MGKTPSPFVDDNTDNTNKNETKYWVGIVQFKKTTGPGGPEAKETTKVFPGKNSDEARRRAERYVEIMENQYPSPAWTVQLETWQEAEGWLRVAALTDESLNELRERLR